MEFVDYSRVARDVKDNPPIRTPGLSLSTGHIDGVDPGTGTVDLSFGEDPLVLEGVERLSNYVPKVGDDPYVFTSGPDVITLDRDADGKGPSAFRNAVCGRILNSQGLVESDNFVELNATPALGSSPGGPFLQTTIGPSGICMIGISAYCYINSNGEGLGTYGGACASMWITGPDYEVPPLSVYGITYWGNRNTGATVSRVNLGGGLTPGTTFFRMGFCGIGQYASFGLRELWVVPL
jgi:hypothetical protein